jgi:hypothetical protein
MEAAAVEMGWAMVVEMGWAMVVEMGWAMVVEMAWAMVVEMGWAMVAARATEMEVGGSTLEERWRGCACAQRACFRDAGRGSRSLPRG